MNSRPKHSQDAAELGGAQLDDADARYHRLTRNNSVLILVDVQIGPLWELEFATSRRRVAELAGVARRLDLPVVATTITPESWGPIIPELAELVADESVVVRGAVNAWDEREVRRAIDSTDRTKLIIAGSVLDGAVADCALAADRAGYDVYVPIDASGQSSHAGVVRLCRGGAIITTTALVIRDLLSDRTGARRAAERLSAGDMLRQRLRTWRLGG